MPDFDTLNVALRLGAVVGPLPIGTRLVFACESFVGDGVQHIEGAVMYSTGLRGELRVQADSCRYFVPLSEVLEVLSLPTGWSGDPMSLLGGSSIKERG